MSEYDAHFDKATRRALGAFQWVFGVVVTVGAIAALFAVLEWLHAGRVVPGAVLNMLLVLGVPPSILLGVTAARRLRRFQERRLLAAVSPDPPQLVSATAGGSSSTAVR